MSKQTFLVQCVILTAAVLLAACSPATAPTPVFATPTVVSVPPTTAAPTAASAQPTTGPAATVAALSDDSSIKVGLVTDTGGVNDHAFNQLAWEALQKAAEEVGFETTFIESQQPTDYEANIDALATDGYNVIITVGSSMGNATALMLQL